MELLINCKLRRSQSSLHTARRCIPNVPTYISNDHEHQNGTINSSLVGVIIGDWKFYNHQGLCFNSKRSIRVGLMDITIQSATLTFLKNEIKWKNAPPLSA
ncbi:hypothetical protein H8356DRAFT_1336355 [Neocallimastix lanati (nom. inval.)]|nr:hypothetical protein H8356DRAFT_1336355 [Neocallimastix sp. JGI-2020a]